MAYSISDSVSSPKSGILHCGALLALVITCAIGMSAQGNPAAQRRGKNSSGPRALGLVVFGEDAGVRAAVAAKKKPQLPRLIPGTLGFEQSVFDAAVYKAAPLPQATQTDILNEV